MSGLVECLKKMGLDKHEAAILRGMASEHREDGKGARQAAEAALRDYVRTALTDRRSIAEQVIKATGGDLPPAPDVGSVLTPPPKNERARSLLDEIKKMGGINAADVLDVFGERAHMVNRNYPGLVTKSGEGLDEMARVLAERGWLPERALDEPDGGVRMLTDMLDAELKGTSKAVAAGDEDTVMRKEAERRAKEDDERVSSDLAKAAAKEDEDAGTGIDDAAVAKARSIDEAAVENLPDSLEPAAYMDEIRKIIDGGGKSSSFDGTLFGGLPLNAMAKAVADAWGWASRNAGPWMKMVVQASKDIAAKSGAAVKSFYMALSEGAATELRSKLEAFNSPTAQAVIDHFHTKAGSDKVTGETYESAVNTRVMEFAGRLSKILGDLAGDQATMRQVANAIRTGRGLGNVGAMGKDVAKLLKDIHTYMTEAGVDIGEIRSGYYPREFVIDKVLSDPKGFENAVTQAYMDNGMGRSEARAAATALSTAVQFGGLDALFVPDRGNVRTPFTKERVFGPSVDQPSHPLNAFLQADPAINITSYITRAVRRAEIARRFGDQFSKWDDMARKIVDEGAGSELENIKNFIGLAAGLKRPGIDSGSIVKAAYVRTWASLMFLEKATLSSLSEFMVPVIRTGNAMDAARSLRNVVTDLFARKASMSAQERRALAEDFMIVGDQLHDQINAARFSGGDPITMGASKVLDKYFRRTGLTQLTESQRVAATDIGRVFLRRQAKGVLEGSKLAKRQLAELGIPHSEMDEFAKAVLARNDGMVTAPDVQAMPKQVRDRYRVAVRRFVSQSIQNPDPTHRPRWMSHPWGAVVGQLQSFNYAFYENVVKRQARLTKEAVVGSDYSPMERAQMMSAFVTLPMLYAVGFAIGEGRDALFGDPERRKEETPAKKATKALSRAIPIAPLDPWLNYLTSAKYQRSAVDFAAGPFFGTFGRGIDAARSAAFNNSDKTNSAERNAAKAVYDLLIEPTINLALTKMPGGVAGQAAAAAITQAAGSGRTRDAFVESVAGPKKDKTRDAARL